MRVWSCQFIFMMNGGGPVAGAIVWQPPKEREDAAKEKGTFQKNKIAFFDEKSAKLYNISVNRESTIYLADFSSTVLPDMKAKSSEKGNTFPLDRFTSCEMGIIASRR